MCAYCNVGDTWFRHDPPWAPQPWPPTVPQPLSPQPINPWPLDKLQAYYELLKQVKELEDQLGCPCEPNKADYIGMFAERIKALEEAVAKKAAS